MGNVAIDMVTEDKANDEFVLYLVENGPWPPTAEQMTKTLRRIQYRIFAAVDAVLDGSLVKKYPDAHGKKVRIQIDSPHGQPVKLRQLVDNIETYIKNNSSEYALAIEKSRYVSGIRIVTGHELGRFGGDYPERN